MEPESSGGRVDICRWAVRVGGVRKWNIVSVWCIGTGIGRWLGVVYLLSPTPDTRSVVNLGFNGTIFMLG